MEGYFAFISYAREDMDVAGWIHSKLEKYPYPKEFVKEENRPSHPYLIRKIFIDTKDLPVTINKYTDNIRKAISESRYMIVICSEHSASSVHVSEEIRYFLETHENNSSLILPVIIDKVENSVPEPLADIGIIDRNCPIYRSNMDRRSDMNLYCFYHIVAFLLKVDFTLLYDRYRKYAQRKYRRKFGSVIVAFALLVSIIVLLLLSLSRQKELTRFERDIFPLSIVFGYNNNFLIPLVEYIKSKGDDAEIFIMMPYSADDLDHQTRIERVKNIIMDEFNADSLYSVNLPTKVKRGTLVGKIASDHDGFDGVYVDFSSTTSTFSQIIEYKKSKYADIDEDMLVKEYADTYIRQSLELLGKDSLYVHYFTDIDKFIDAIRYKAYYGRN